MVNRSRVIFINFRLRKAFTFYKLLSKTNAENILFVVIYVFDVYDMFFDSFV